VRKKNKTFVGYVTPNIFNGMKVPLTLQHRAINDHINSLSGVYKLSQTELIIEEAYTTLFSILNNSKNYSNIIMCSLFMLPGNLKLRNEILNIIIKKKINLYFVFEKFVLNHRNINDFELFLKLFNSVKNPNYPFK
jgi:sporadic carbohydrate cluster protein (TIGR04323 family)